MSGFFEPALPRRLSWTLIVALVVAAAGVAGLAASAAADTLLGSTLLGSTLLDEQESSTFGGGAGLTVYQQAAGGELLTAPADGAIRSWSVRSGDASAEYELRIIRAAAGGKFTAEGTSAPQTVPDSEDKVRGPFAVDLLVKAGDRIALDVIKGPGAPVHIGALAGELNYVGDPFGEGTTKEPVLPPPLSTNQELLLQADFKPAPLNTSPPTISGEARAGTLLSASEGAWEGASSFAFQWERCGATCSAISGATSQTYTPTSADEGQQLRVDVTASGEGGKTTASSELTDGVKPAPPSPPVSTGPPVLSGEPRETETLSSTNGNWAGSPTQFAYQWLRCATASGGNCAPLSGATSNSYKLVHADAGSTMRLMVTATNAEGPTTAESAPSAIVQPLTIRARLAVAPSPSCTATPTTFDASASQTPNLPITRYRFTYINVPIIFQLLIPEGETEEQWFSKQPSYLLADGANPRPTAEFTWNRPWTHELDFGSESEKLGDFVRDPIRVTVEVTDLAGATATASQILYFSSLNNQYSDEGRQHCAKTSLVINEARIGLLFARTVVSKSAVATTIRCVTVTPCAGKLSVLSTRALIAAAGARAHAKRKPPVIASNPFFSIAGHHSAVIRAKLTATGHKLLRHSKAVRAVVQLTSITPAGKATTRSLHVVLHGK